MKTKIKNNFTRFFAKTEPKPSLAGPISDAENSRFSWLTENVKKLAGSFDDCLRRMCGAMTPFKRFVTILIICIIFGVVNIYITVSAIYNIGRNDVMKELQEIEQQRINPIALPDNNSNNQLINKENDSE
jgi:hypothetical protein